MSSFGYSLSVPPPASFRGRVFYHGTETEIAARAILESGKIIAGVREDGRRRKQPRRAIRSGGALTPMPGRVYLASRPAAAMSFALGWDFEKSTWYPDAHRYVEKSRSRYGWVFVIEGASLSDVLPDEDRVGELLAHHDAEFNWLVELASKVMSHEQLRAVWGADYRDKVIAGKRLIAAMTSSQLRQVIDVCDTVSASSPVRFVEAWRVDKYESSRLDPQTANNWQSVLERKL